MNSPRGLKNIDLGGVGLGIVAALEKSGDGGREVLSKFAISSSNLSRSKSIRTSLAKNDNCDGLNINRVFEDFESESLENYSYVTRRHGSNNKPITKVFYDGGENSRFEHQINDFERFKKLGIFYSPSEEFSLFPTSDFLSSCHLCCVKLHGKDIFMYRGEKAFCCTECRSKHIMID